MTGKEFVHIDVGLILLRYGRTAVLNAIAHRVGVSEEELMNEVERLRVTKELSDAKKKRSVAKFDLNSILVGRDDKAVNLIKLSERFENRTFLPELKDLKRFFERHGGSASSVKSRASAQNRLFKMLANFGNAELERLLAEAPGNSKESSLGLISDEILGRARKNAPHKTDSPKE